MAFLYINQEILLKNTFPIEMRLKLSLACAIFLATMNNYLWNRWWTWGDRKDKTPYGFFIQMGRYFLASGLAIALQYVVTILLSRMVYYLLANVMAIILAAFVVYIINDIWTFTVKKIESGEDRDGTEVAEIQRKTEEESEKSEEEKDSTIDKNIFLELRESSS